MRSYRSDRWQPQRMTAPRRAQWWRQQRRKWRQDIRAAMPRFDLKGLS